ncbi:MAG: TIGR03032 family protein [Nocardioides sp.]|nr:TIGR03032 family protein [Nocardioides sp.]
MEAGFTHSASLPDVLGGSGASLLVSTYQAGQLVAVGVDDGKVAFDFHRFDQAMGVAVGQDRLAVGAKGQVWFLDDHSELAPQLEPAGHFDRCFLARSSMVTGGIQIHEMAWGVDAEGQPDLWIVNTLFSCLVGLDPAYSFVPRWRPPFISRLAGEDRCHLNGMAMRDGAPAFVTVMARSDTPGGWRENKLTTGTVLHVPSGEVVTTGISMPHSPRWYDGQLFVLDSGMGHLQRVDVQSGRREMVAALPGYARGLAIHDGLAYVGLSKIRETAVFGGVPIAEFHDQLKCGIGVIELATGNTVATLEFTSGLEEIFDVQVVPDSRCVALGSAPGDGDEIWLVPAPR